MTEPTPRITVGLPVYNGEPFLRDALDSLLRQTEERFEIVIVDNGSTDGSAAIIDEYALSDGRIRVERSPTNRGAAWSHNRAVELARGEYFRWAAADDASNATYLEACLQTLVEAPEAVLAYPRVADIDEAGHELTAPYSVEGEDVSAPVDRFGLMALSLHSCFQVYGLMPTAVLRRTGRIGSYTSSDRVLLAELALLGAFVEAEPAVLYHREHGQRSMRQYRDLRARAEWFDPRNAGRQVRPTLRVAVELGRAIFRAGLDARDRVAAFGVVASFVWRRRRQSLGELLPASLRSVAAGARKRRLRSSDGGA